MHWWKYSFLKTALFVEGEGDWIIAYQSRVFRFGIDSEDPTNLKTVRRAAQFLGIHPAPTDIWDFISDLRDDRPDVLIARHDGNRLLIESVGDYAHQTGSRLLQNVIKELGYEQVVYTSEGEEYKSAWDFQVKGDIPRLLYHGTTSEHAGKILRFGLQPGESETNYPDIHHYDTVFLAEDIAKAAYHAQNAVSRDLEVGYSGPYSYTRGRTRGFPVVFQFEIPDPNLLVPDYDVENRSAQPSGTYEGVYIPQPSRVYEGVYTSPQIRKLVKESPFDLSKKVGIFGYRGRIPANFIRRIMIETTESEGGMFFQDHWTEITPAQLQQAVEYGDVSMAFFEPEDEDEICPECGWTKNDSGNCNCPDNLPLYERQPSGKQSCRCNWLKKIARPQYGFLGKEFTALRAVDLKRALNVLSNGFSANEFFATDTNRAVFYGHFTRDKYPNIIFQCQLDSSRSSVDTNDADNQSEETSYDAIQQAAFEIHRLVKNYNIQESDIERFIGSQLGMGYDNVDAPSLWVYLNQLTNVPINEIKQSITPGYYGNYGTLVLDNRGVFGVTDDIPEMQLQYSAPVPLENIEKVYIHSSILDAFRYHYPRYPNGNPIGLSDEVSVIPAQVREFAQQIEEQIKQTNDEDLREELESLLSGLSESIGRYEDETNSAPMDGTIYRKLYRDLPLRIEDFQNVGGFVGFAMPQQRMQVILIIKKALSHPDPRQMYLFPMSKHHGWLKKLSSD